MKLPQHFGTFLTAVLLTVPAYGQHMNEKASPCANVVATAELSNCFFGARLTADVKLESVYKKIRSRLGADDATSLTKTQRLWFRYRDANCSAERNLYEGGTAKAPVYYACLESMTRGRTRELQVTYAVRLK
jgi:uncharacterized protein YecT (DUF1311 family)